WSLPTINRLLHARCGIVVEAGLDTVGASNDRRQAMRRPHQSLLLRFAQRRCRRLARHEYRETSATGENNGRAEAPVAIKILAVESDWELPVPDGLKVVVFVLRSRPAPSKSPRLQ